jgi:hypothetical protein
MGKPYLLVEFLHPFFINKTEGEGELNFTLKMNMKN